MKISVIVPVYNSGQYLERVLQALNDQDYPPDQYELIFVDNGSTDDSVAILEQQTNILLLSESERGSYAARNAGIKRARGEILAFTDSDCFPEPDWLSVIDRTLETQSTQLILGRRIPSGDGRWIKMAAEYENLKTEQICQSDDPAVYFGYTNNMAVRRQVMDELGPFITRPRGADTMFVIHVARNLSCSAIGFCRDMVIRHAELTSVRAYFKKMKTYGRSRTANRHIAITRTLNSAERWHVFRRMARDLNSPQTLGLFMVLSCGAMAWYWGEYGPGRRDHY